MNIQDLTAQLQALAGGGSPGGTVGGALSDFADLQKALEATQEGITDVATLEGGGALGVQSLDPVLKATIQENEHFVLFNQLAKTNATNIVDEYITQSGVGGFPGGSTNQQMGVVRAAQGEYAREVGFVKFLMTLRQVGYVLQIGKNVSDAMSLEEMNGAKQLLTDSEYLLFHGNADACPTEFSGIYKLIDDEIAAGKISSDHVYDMQGSALTDIVPFTAINKAVFDYGSWGQITDCYMPNAVSGDLDQKLDPAYRWVPEGSNTPMLGGHVEAIRLTQGVLKTRIDTFLHHDEFPMAKPFEVTWPALAAANTFVPQGVAVDAATSDASSQFGATRAGNYYWAVAAIGANGEGQSVVVKSTQTAVADGKKAVLTITASVAGTETGYAIYRSRMNGTNATDDFRLVTIIPKSGATTVYTDLNRDIPGTCRVPVLCLKPGSDSIGWRQYQPMTKIPLPFGVGLQPVYSWFQFLFGYLRMTKPKHHGYIKNILPSTATWLPFG